MNGLCPHNRHIGAVCLECPSGTAMAELDSLSDSIEGCAVSNPEYPAGNSGLHADYYVIPLMKKHRDRGWIDLIDIIEWLEEGGMTSAGMNQLKSHFREYNPHAKKNTTPLYEAGKRLFYAQRHYAVVWRHHEMERQGKRARQQAEERMREETDSADDAQDGEVS